MSEEVSIISALNQLLKKGDIIFVFSGYSIRSLVILSILPQKTTDGRVVLRRSRIKGLEVHGYRPQIWNAEIGKYEYQDYKVAVSKTHCTNINLVLKLDDSSELYKYGVDPRVANVICEERQKVLDGFYDKKPKKKKKNE